MFLDKLVIIKSVGDKRQYRLCVKLNENDPFFNVILDLRHSIQKATQ